MCYKLIVILLILACWGGVGVAQTDTPTETPTASPSDTPTDTPTATFTITNTSTRTPTITRTPLPVDTATPTSTSTRTKTATPAPVNTSTVTPIPAATGTRTATRTYTPVLNLVAASNAGCVVLSATPQALGQPGRRRGLAFWMNGGEGWCGYNPETINRTPGPDSGAHYSDGQGLSRCECQDAVLYCIGDNTVQACWDQCADQTPTVTVTATATATPEP